MRLAVLVNIAFNNYRRNTNRNKESNAVCCADRVEIQIKMVGVLPIRIAYIVSFSERNVKESLVYTADTDSIYSLTFGALALRQRETLKKGRCIAEVWKARSNVSSEGPLSERKT